MNFNNDPMLAQLENELRGLQPLPPDPSVMLRLNRAMSEPLVDRAPTTKIISFQEAAAAKEANRIAVKPWLAVAACAAVVTGGVTWNQARLANQNTIAEKPTIIPQVPQYVQKSSQSQFQSVHQAGLVFDPTHGPMRKVRFQFDNHEQFVDPSNGARIEIRYPSQQEILIIEPVQ